MIPTDYDSLWKGVIEDFFEDFLLFFAPDLSEKVDFKKGFAFLENELLKLFDESESSKSQADKLAKVYLKDGEEKWVLIHVEIQGYREKGFPERMFRYFYRIYDRFDKKIFALSLFTDEHLNYMPDKYTYDFFDTRLTYSYRTYKLLNQNEAGLIESDNPFALAVLAGIYTIKSKKDISLRYAFKLNLARLLFQKQWTRDKIEKLFVFIDGILSLPENTEIMFNKELSKELEKGGIKVGLTWDDSNLAKVYIEKGKSEGRAEGKTQGKAESLIRLMQKKFRSLPKPYEEKIMTLSEVKLNALIDNILDIEDLDEIKKYL